MESWNKEKVPNWHGKMLNTCMTNLILSKAEYKKAVAKHFLLAQLFRFLGWTCMLDLAKSKEKDKGTPEESNLGEVDIRKEAMGLLFR